MKHMMNSFILSAYVAIAPAQVYANPEQEALKQLTKACYKQFKIDDYVKTLEKKLLSKKLRKYGGYAAVGVRMVAEQKVAYTWTF